MDAPPLQVGRGRTTGQPPPSAPWARAFLARTMRSQREPPMGPGSTGAACDWIPHVAAGPGLGAQVTGPGVTWCGGVGRGLTEGVWQAPAFLYSSCTVCCGVTVLGHHRAQAHGHTWRVCRTTGSENEREEKTSVREDRVPDSGPEETASKPRGRQVAYLGTAAPDTVKSHTVPCADRVGQSQDRNRPGVPGTDWHVLSWPQFPGVPFQGWQAPVHSGAPILQVA